MIRLIHTHWMLLIVLCVAGFLRVYHLTQVPYGLYCDEANIGVSAYSLLATGMDEHGARWPLFFNGFGEGRLPLSIYMTIPFIWSLGLSVFSVRIAAVFYSMIAVVLMYMIGTVWVSRKFGTIAALMLSVSPWAIHMSRLGWEISYVLPVLLMSLYCFSLSGAKPQSVISGYFFLGLTQYTYYSGTVVAPCISAVLSLYLIITSKRKQFVIVGILIYVLCSVPLLIGYTKGKILQRMDIIANETSIGKEPLMTKILTGARAYINHYQPDYLFFHEKEYEFITRHSVRGVGQLPRYAIILLPVGLFFLYFFRLKPNGKIAIVITMSVLLLYPLTGLANEKQMPIATRSYPGVIAYALVLAYGIYGLMHVSKKQKFLRAILISIIGLSILVDLRYFYQKYFIDYPMYSSDYWGWQAGPEEVITYFKKEQDDYDELYLTGYFNAPEVFLRFFDPESTCKKCMIGSYNSYQEQKKQLFALRKEDIENAKKDRPDLEFFLIKTVDLPNGVPELYIGTFQGK